ncbi:hypothetical protein T11_5092 [Trichinella zimbabwensis]|uniref:Uncharacterized protein n=1 Tax=Trichinella zimbabwensis TaxID=268475 RepID=A0A0V1HFU4_9BILA|nr:hypothetical protein T11_5092 [Trichinella zimbabwensis]
MINFCYVGGSASCALSASCVSCWLAPYDLRHITTATNNSLTTALGNLLIFGAPLQQILAKIRNFYDPSPPSFLIINMSAIRRHLEEQESCSSVERRALSRGGLG